MQIKIDRDFMENRAEYAKIRDFEEKEIIKNGRYD